MNCKKKISIVFYSGAHSLDVIGPAEVFSLANQQLKDKGLSCDDQYEIEFLAEDGDTKLVSSGLRLCADRCFTDSKDIHTLLIGGNLHDEAERFNVSESLKHWISIQSGLVERIGCIGNGALILAEVGLLNGRRATTHWRYVDLLKVFPEVEVDEDSVFVKDGHVFTSAGVSAGVDLALAMVEEDFGRGIALSVAQLMVLYLKRDSDHKQSSTYLLSQLQSDRFLDLVQWIHSNLEQSLCVNSLAEKASMSPRNFARCFTRDMGVTPGRFVEKIRVEKVCQLLATQALTQERIATICGFKSQEQLRRAFRRNKGMLPREYRQKISG
ncbi:helix-turn-helix domain-containing protein [Microbulbifer sp. OS29]|uniref:Helix-turn-helix domain-containing protein n=1 Tax=Microbulbifer okhotskensis TaxID=2926617 RepID=A0A9X2J5Q1_9GAMM|nr:helix-turn-helix domain-containing protein [Microbulbifer okhotskensis]MCO1335787.1 helix-turn-helix domain-containing protein [Microbulbifer okhotskensis]